MCERTGVLKRPFPKDHAVRKVEEQHSRCKFNDCKHKTEPGCAVKEAIKTGILSEQRLKLYERLSAEGKRKKYNIH